jgi:hypothetical protein
MEPPLMSPDTAPNTTSLSRSKPLKAAMTTLVSELLGTSLPAYPVYPQPSDHEGFAAHIRDVAVIFDRYLAAIGAEVRDNATTSIDAGLFAGSFTAAVDGNETWAAEQQASALRDFASERRHARGGW